MRQRIRNIIRKEFLQAFREPRMLPGFGRDVQHGRATSVQVVLDGSNSNEASIVSGYAGQTIARYSAKVAAEQSREKQVARPALGSEPKAPAPRIATRSRVWFN